MKNVEEIIKSFQKVRLSEVERASLRSALDNHIRSNPLPSPISSPFFNTGFFFRRHLLVMSFAALFLVSSGSALFAEQSLPGDVLYGLKRGVNEEVRGWLADSPEDRALWQLSLAERRLAEIESLSEQNKLSEEVQLELSLEVDAYTENALSDDGEDSVFEEDLFATSVIEEVVPAPEPVLMKMSLGAENSSIVSSDEVETPAITAEEINSLGEEIKEEQKNIQAGNKAKSDQRAFIRAKGRLLIAEKKIFESKQALKRGDVSSAQNLFLDAQSAFDLVSPVPEEVAPPEEEVLSEEAPLEGGVSEVDSSHEPNGRGNSEETPRKSDS